VQFRSHFGSFGDLVGELLCYRDPQKKALSIVSDLSSTNMISCNDVKIIQAGCTAHARRRFAKANDGDVEYRDLVMYMFNVLYSHEECLDLKGRNRDNTAAIRQKNSKTIWEKMKLECEHIASKYSSSTDLGDAARYVLRNYQALTEH